MIKLNQLPQLIAALAVLGQVGVHAKNIQVCEKLQKDVEIAEINFDEVINQGDKLSNDEKHCKAARSYQLAMIKDQNLAIENGLDMKILRELHHGNYINDYTNFALALKKLNKNHANSEEIHYLLTDLYAKNLPKDITHMPIGNFINEDGSATDIVSEAVMVQSDFIRKYPNSNFNTDVENKLQQSHQVLLEKAISDFKNEIKLNRRSKDQDIYEYQSAVLIDKIATTEDSSIRNEALGELLELYLNHSKLAGASHKASQIAGILMSSDKLSRREAKKINKKLKKAKISTQNATSIIELQESIHNSSKLQKSMLSDADLKNLIKNKKGNDRSIFMPIEFSDTEKKNMLRTLGVVGVMLAFDQPLMNFVQDNKSDTLTTVTDFTNSFGETSGLIPLVGASMAVGLVFKNDQLKRAAVRSVGAVLIGQLATQLLKTLTSRSRPREGNGPYDFNGVNFGRNNTSFSSGHSAGAWSVMTVFATEFKDTKIVPIAAYSLAALTSFARVYKEAHWFSDVTLGALIGWVSGKIMYRLFDKKQDGPVSFTPVTGDLNGGAVTYKIEGQKDLKAWPKDYYQLNFL